MGKVLIVEPMLSGHHSIYLLHCINATLDSENDLVLVLADDWVNYPELARVVKNNLSRIEIRLIDGGGIDRALRSSLPLRELRFWLLFRSIFKSAKLEVDQVILPYFDYCLYATSLLGSPFGRSTFSAVVMRPAFHLMEMGAVGPCGVTQKIKRAAFLLLLRRNINLFLIDELLKTWADKKSRRARALYLSDPAELSPHNSISVARELQSLSGRLVVLVYGALDERKGIEELLAGIGPVEGAVALIVGRQSKEVSAKINAWRAEPRNAGKIHSINRFVDQSEERSVFEAADVVWVGYRRHYGMSGVLVLAARAGKPVLSNSEGLIGWYVTKYRLGIALGDMRPESVRNGLASLKAGDFSVDASEFVARRTWRDFECDIRAVLGYQAHQ